MHRSRRGCPILRSLQELALSTTEGAGRDGASTAGCIICAAKTEGDPFRLIPYHRRHTRGSPPRTGHTPAPPFFHSRCDRVTLPLHFSCAITAEADALRRT